jgi:hypothetical protein
MSLGAGMLSSAARAANAGLKAERWMPYNPSSIESKWQAYWAKHDGCRAELDLAKPKFYVLDGLPNSSTRDLAPDPIRTSIRTSQTKGPGYSKPFLTGRFGNQTIVPANPCWYFGRQAWPTGKQRSFPEFLGNFRRGTARP